MSSQLVGDSGVIALCRVGALNRSETIKLSFNNIRSLGAEAIAKGISGSSSLTSIYLGWNDLTNEDEDMTGVEALAHAISVSKSLEKCELRNSNLCTKGWCTVIDALRDKPENRIARWELNNEGINSEIAESLAAYLTVSKSLTVVNLLTNDLDADSVSMLLKAKEKNPQLKTLCGLAHEETELDLSLKKLDPVDALMLAPEIAASESLTWINLRRNKLCGLNYDDGIGTYTTEGIVAISRAVSACKSLTRIDLADNGLGVKGGKAIAGAISDSKTLTNIDLSMNNLCGLNYEGHGTYSANGIIAISKAISTSKSLREIYLWDNNLTDECLQLLRNAVENKVNFYLYME